MDKKKRQGVADRPKDWARKLAAEAGVSVRTLERSAKFAAAVDALEAARPGLKARILDGPDRIPHDMVGLAAVLAATGRTDEADRLLTADGLKEYRKRTKEQDRDRELLAATRRLLRLAGSVDEAVLYCRGVDAIDNEKD